MLVSIIKIILSFVYVFIFQNTSSMDNILGKHLYPLTMWYLLCWAYKVPRAIDDVEVFPQGWYAQTILHIWPFFPFIFIHHHLPIPVLSIPDSNTHPEIVSNAKTPLLTFCALYSSSWTFCVVTSWRLVL